MKRTNHSRLVLYDLMIYKLSYIKYGNWQTHYLSNDIVSCIWKNILFYFFEIDVEIILCIYRVHSLLLSCTRWPRQTRISNFLMPSAEYNFTFFFHKQLAGDKESDFLLGPESESLNSNLEELISEQIF